MLKWVLAAWTVAGLVALAADYDERLAWLLVIAVLLLVLFKTAGATAGIQRAWSALMGS